MIVLLTTLEAAKDNLDVDHDLDDRKITRMVLHASSLILNYLKTDGSIWGHGSPPELGSPVDIDVPPLVEAATLLTIGALYENRDGQDWRTPQPLSQGVRDILARLYPPSMA